MNDRQHDPLFLDPPAQYRTAPLWVWNDAMTREQIREQLRQLKEHGFGGAFVHPRPGLITEYLSEEWFTLWSDALQAAQESGLLLYIYDENSYPSGFAGGHVPSELPDCLAQSVVCWEMTAEQVAADPPPGSSPLRSAGPFIRVFACADDGAPSGELQVTHDITSEPVAAWPAYGKRFLVFAWERPHTTPWLGGFAFVDALRPEVAKQFLKTTYERYKTHFGAEFGKRIPAVFTDEPAIFASAGAHTDAALLPYSAWLAAKFAERNGYSLQDHLPCLFRHAAGEKMHVPPQKVRYDYYCTLRQLWAENFVQPLSRWCEENGIAFTGHYLEHQWPFASGTMASPAVMSLYEFMHWPAIDMLLTHLLRERPADPLLLTIREVSSAANQFDRERVLCETYGAGGWDSTFADYKRIGDWLMVHGVNFINQHLTYATIVGARKRDHPQSFDWRQTWWQEYRLLNDYHGRLSYALSQGRTVNRILVLHPTTTAFLLAPGEEKGNLFQGDVPTHPDMRTYVHLLQWLSDGQWDFDLGDEFIMQRHARALSGKMAVGSRRYDVVVVPEAMRHMNAATVRLLEDYVKSGGTVLFLGDPAVYVEGLASDAVRILSGLPGCFLVRTLDGLATRLDRLVPRRLRWRAAVGEGVAHLRREWSDGSSVYFIANSRSEPVSSTLQIAGSHVEKWDAFTGQIEDVAYERRDGTVVTEMVIPPYGSALLRVTEKSRPSDPAAPARRETKRAALSALPCGELVILPEEDNVLVLDYCDLRIDGLEYRDIHTLYAGHLVYEHRGYPENPWDNAVQFKRRVVDAEPATTGGFTVVYRFAAAPEALPDRLRVHVERGRSYELRVNGQRAKWTQGGEWLDEHMNSADIRPFVVPGDNEIVLSAPSFNVLLEIEPIYLRGAFAARNVGGHWRVEPQAPWRTGFWPEQGYPFYAGSVLYKKSVHIPDGAGKIVVRAPRLQGTVASVLVDGQMIGLFGSGQEDAVDITSLARPGTREVAIRVCGSLKNALGPHHDQNKPRGTAWPGMWKKAPQRGQPAASQYDLIAYGLLEDFQVEQVF